MICPNAIGCLFPPIVSQVLSHCPSVHICFFPLSQLKAKGVPPSDRRCRCCLLSPISLVVWLCLMLFSPAAYLLTCVPTCRPV